MLDLSPLAAWAVAFLAPYFGKAADKAVETLGESAAGSLYATLKNTLKPVAAEALKDLRQVPDDADMQAALRVALKKALAHDPTLAAWLAQQQQAARGGTTQTATQTGDGNVSAQNAGSGNSFQIR